MTADEFAGQNAQEIETLKKAYALRRETKSQFVRISKNDDSTDERIDRAGDEMREADNEYQRLDLALRARAEKQIGRGPELGLFYETYVRTA